MFYVIFNSFFFQFPNIFALAIRAPPSKLYVELVGLLRDAVTRYTFNSIVVVMCKQLRSNTYA